MCGETVGAADRGQDNGLASPGNVSHQIQLPNPVTLSGSSEIDRQRSARTSAHGRRSQSLGDQPRPILCEQHRGIARRRGGRRYRDAAPIRVKQQHDRVAVAGVLRERPTGGGFDRDSRSDIGETSVLGSDGAYGRRDDQPQRRRRGERYEGAQARPRPTGRAWDREKRSWHRPGL